MDKTGNQALDPLSLIKLNKINWNELYKEYLKSYQIIHKIANKIKKEYINIIDKDKIKERKIVYDMEREIIENIIIIERYLPQEKRYFTNKQIEQYKDMTFNKSCDFGLVPIEKLDRKKIEELVHKKILHEELKRMLKELLTDKQYECVYMYYFEGMTQEEISKKLEITQPEVNDKIQISIDKIKKSEYFLEFIKNIY